VSVDWIGLYLQEDLGPGDVTSDALFGPGVAGRARMVAREGGVIAGLAHAGEVYSRLGVATARPSHEDGQRVAAGAVLMTVEGPARAILAGERLALNVVGRMSGIATATRAAADALAAAGSKAKVAATRKTTPGFRAFEKEAVALGGGVPHRMGLWDAAMLKDNHLEAWAHVALAQAAPETVADAVRRVAAANPGREVACEVESLPHALAAAGAGADWILVDNQPAETGRAWAQAVRKRHPGVRIEASGGIAVEDVAAFAWADRVSLGGLTTRARSLDVALEWAA
jgi:nicotinate-nucleotide pyrophosphorylase (carboxylating)